MCMRARIAPPLWKPIRRRNNGIPPWARANRHSNTSRLILTEHVDHHIEYHIISQPLATSRFESNMKMPKQENEQLPTNELICLKARIKGVEESIVPAFVTVGIIVFFGAVFWGAIEIVRMLPTNISLPLRCLCIVLAFLGILKENLNLLIVLRIVSRANLLKTGRIDPSNTKHVTSSRIDPETRTSNFEDQALVLLFVVANYATLGIVTWYWITVIELMFKSLLYWAYALEALFVVFQILTKAMAYYRKSKGLRNSTETVDVVCAATAWLLIHTFQKFETWKSEGKFEPFIQAASLMGQLPECFRFAIGLNMGFGPWFGENFNINDIVQLLTATDRLPEDLKAARRACKTPEDVHRLWPSCGTPYEEDDAKANSSPKTEQIITVNPQDVELGLNPVIFGHLLDTPNRSPQPDCTAANQSSIDLDLDTPMTSEPAQSIPETDKISKERELISSMPIDDEVMRPFTHNGPVTNPVTLSSFACSHCAYTFDKPYKLKYTFCSSQFSLILTACSKHINQMRAHRFRCSYHSCEKTFALRTNLERHELTHTGGERFTCPNSWCEDSEQTFGRRDNLERHVRRCSALR
jgi:hypothetical protein